MLIATMRVRYGSSANSVGEDIGQDGQTAEITT